MHIMNVTDAWESMPTPHDAKDPWEDLYKDVYFYDDITGYSLEQDRAAEARKLEMEFSRKMQCEFHALRIRAAKLNSLINIPSVEKASLQHMHRWQLAGGPACATNTYDQRIGLLATSLDEAVSLAFITQTLQELHRPDRLLHD